MADNSQIEWTEATWSPITGCSILSPGCTNCYAMQLAGTRLQHHPSRKGLTAMAPRGPVWTGEVRFNDGTNGTPEWLTQPLKWKRPRRIFVCAHADLFNVDVPDEWIDKVFAVMALAAHHTFQVLTKRSGRMRAYFADPAWKARVLAEADRMKPSGQWNGNYWQADYDLGDHDCLRNVWLGISAEDQRRFDERAADLLVIPAAVRWISFEPLLGQIDAWELLKTGAFGWAVVGGESGPNARPMHPDWARSLRDQCAEAGVPFLFKQWGEWAPVCEMSEELIDDIYVPAPERDPEATRRCKVDQCVLHADGKRFGGSAMFQRPAFEQGSRAMTMFAVGKKRAGRLLVGRTHDGYPERIVA